MSFQRLIITFKPQKLIVHALYRTQDSLGLNTKARRRGLPSPFLAPTTLQSRGSGKDVVQTTKAQA
jgi:hypothetical protein